MRRSIIAGLVLAVIQSGAIAGLGVKASADRERLPRAWVKVRPVNTRVAVTGRYLQLYLVPESDVDPTKWPRVALSIRDGRVVARAVGGNGVRLFKPRDAGSLPAVLFPAVEHYVPPSGEEPARLATKDLWMEVSVPARGAPRGVQLGVMVDGRIRPLGY